MKTKKAMKKITHIGMAALVAMGMLGTSCNKAESPEIETPETQKDNIVTLTTTVGFADDTKALAIDYTAKTLTKTFAVGEQVVLTYKDQDDNNQNTVSQALTPEDISADGKSAKLTFTLTNPKTDGYIAYQYPASESNFYAQNGTLTDVATRDYAGYDGSLAGTNLPASATLDNEIAVVAFTLYKSDGTTDITNTITGMTIEVSGVTYTITPSGLDKIYVAMWPEDGSEITITATDGSKNYTKTLTGKTYEAGEFYQQGLKMAAAVYKLLSAATAEDIGKVVCAAGHLHEAKTAVPAICTAVGILGKVTETGHGLILALQDATSQNWNTINGWTSVTTYAGTTLKVLPDDAARGANLTSYTALGTTAVSNWAVAQKSDYEAIFKNLGSTQGDSDGTTCDGNANAYITNGVDGTEISGSYWSATVKSESAWYFDTYWAGSNVSNPFFVRPVLGFGGDAAPAGPTAYTLAESTVGMIVGTDGKAYAAADKDNLPLGVTAVAMVAYKSGSNGLAIQLNSDPEKMNWAGAKTNAEGLTAVPGGTWRLPSKDDWQNMFVGCAVSGDATVPDAYNQMNPIAGFKAKIAATGITWKTTNYWSSTEDSGPLAWIVRVKLDDGDALAAFSQSHTSLTMAVLGCLAF